MPKIKVLSRSLDDYVRDSAHDIQKVHRDYTPEAHPFETQREYIKALNATKLAKNFAKPFLYDLDGHKDQVNVLAAHKKRLTTIYSGSYDGVVKEWNLASRTENFSITAHQGKVTGCVSTTVGNRLLTTGMDSLIKFWNNDPIDGIASQVDSQVGSGLSGKIGNQNIRADNAKLNEPINQISAKTQFTNLDCQWRETADNNFAAAGQDGNVYIYHLSGRSDPTRTYKWGDDSLTCVKFNPTEHELLAACGMDRGVTLYDIRQPKPVRKVTLAMNSNQIAWNPYNPLMFAVANEDYQTYLFDMRMLDHASKILKGHVHAVMSCCFSPTGRKIVTGGYDKTLRIYDVHGNNNSNAANVYHTKRMQRVFGCQWSSDNKYIISASDEMNIRVWKANASERLGYLSASQKQSVNYKQALTKKYANYPEIKRIAKHRHVSKHVLTQTNQHRDIRTSTRKKERNKKLNIKEYSVVPARQSMVVKEQQ